MIPLRDNNPTRTKPHVSYALLAACIAVFFWQLTLGPQGGQAAVYAFGLIPTVLLQGAHLPPELDIVPPVATLFTSMFMHGGWMHLIGNMLYLWIFADNVEDSMGHGRFIAFYLLCGIAAALAQAIPDSSSQIPMVGASGAISGVLGAYLLMYPRAQVLVLIPFGYLSRMVHLQAIWVLGFWFLLQLVSHALAPAGGGGVAFRAHIGGFIAGMLLIPLFRKTRGKLWTPW